MAISYSLIAPKNDTIVVDRTRAADPVNYTFKLKIQNQGTSTVYYKLTESSGAWSISSPSNGELGSVDSGSSAVFTITLQRALPTTDVKETIDFTLEAYSDSGYTNLIESTTFSLTAILADIHSWPDYVNYDFDDGTLQGWSFSSENVTSGGDATVSVVNTYSISPGGYCVRLDRASAGGVTCDFVLSKTVTLPSKSTVVVVWYLYRDSTDSDVYKAAVRVNGNVVFQTSTLDISTTMWDMVGADLSDYAGQTVALDIIVRAEIATGSFYTYLDEIIIAGTDTL